MKNAPLYISIATVAIGISAFSLFTQKEESEVVKTELLMAYPNASNPIAGPIYSKPRSSCVNYSQVYFVRKRYSKRITKEQIISATLINDFLPHYPGGWMAEYLSVKIIAEVNGTTKMCTAPDNHITSEQRELLKSLEPLDGITIKIRYKAENSVTGEMETSMMEYSMGVVPNVDAEFKGGQDELIKYLGSTTWTRITEYGYDPSEMKSTAIRFTINHEGKAEDINVFIESGNEKVDAVLLEAIANMPAWIPAENFNGEKAKQQFEVVLGDGC